MLTGKDRKALLDVLGSLAAVDERELRQAFATGKVRGFGAGEVRAIALRKGLLEGDERALWAGLKQAQRLRWLDHPRFSNPGYTSFYQACELLTAGDKTLFERWLESMPPRLDEGNTWCVAMSNALTALARDDEAARQAARRELLRVNGLRASSDFEKATSALATALIDRDAQKASNALGGALSGWARFVATGVASLGGWYLAIIPIGFFALGRDRLGGSITQPVHARWAFPPPLTHDAGPGLVDLSPVSPELEAWWREAPRSVPRAPAMVVAPAASPEEERGLLEAVAADPASDAPREVYADWLLERGLVRGEFIRLQLRKARKEKLTPAEVAREKTLARGAREWLGLHEPAGGLAGVGDPVFERGFLARCTATKTTDDLRWATVLSLVGCVPKPETRLPVLQHLTFRGGAPGFPLQALTSLRLPKLESVVALGTEEWTRPFAPEQLGWLWELPLMARVKRFACALPGEHLPRFVEAWLARLEAFTVSTRAERRWDEGHQVTLVRTRKGLELHVAAAPKGRTDLPDALAAGLTALKAGFFSRAVVDPSAAAPLQVAVAAVSQSTVEKKVPRVSAG